MNFKVFLLRQQVYILIYNKHTIMKANECIVDTKYRISGDLSNGHYADGTPCIAHDDVVRKVKRITSTHIICECGRRFIINDNLKIEKV